MHLFLKAVTAGRGRLQLALLVKLVPYSMFESVGLLLDPAPANHLPHSNGHNSNIHVKLYQGFGVVLKDSVLSLDVSDSSSVLKA